MIIREELRINRHTKEKNDVQHSQVQHLSIAVRIIHFKAITFCAG